MGFSYLLTLGQPGTNFRYGTEVPFANTYCHGPLSCTISETHTTTYTYNGGFTLAGRFLDAVNIGASAGFAYARATAIARSLSIKLEKDQCGYFTWVPVTREVWYILSCGSMDSYLPTTSEAQLTQLGI